MSDEVESLEAMFAGLPHLEVVVIGHRDGYRATATFGDIAAVVIDPDIDLACLLATSQLEAMIASS